MPLDSQANELLREEEASGLPPIHTLSVNAARERMRNAYVNTGEREDVEIVRDCVIPCPGYNLKARIYSPDRERKLPRLLFYHGGGWTVNDLDTHDNLCRSIAKYACVVVVSVDYRLAPEFKYPAAIDDAYLSFIWTFINSNRLNVDASRIAVGGDSAGGTLAAVVCQLARDRGGPKVAFQWLAYPAMDYYLPGTKSYIEAESGCSLTRDLMIWFWNHYLPAAYDRQDPYLFPLHAISYKDLPPAFIMTAQYDPLRDEAEAYGKKVRDSGGTITIKRYEDQMHGFLLQRHRIDNANKAFFELVEAIKNGLR